MIRKLFIFFSIFWFALQANADEVKFTMSAPSIVTLGEQFSLTLSINEQGEELRMPTLDNFDVLYGPNRTSSTSVQYINGKMTRNTSYTYTYVLQAKTEGTFTLNPATIKAKRKVYESNALNIQVIKGRTTNTQPNNSGSRDTQQQTATVSDDDVFVRYEVDKKSAYKGEMISVVLKLYSRVGLSIEDQSLPSFEGFWTQDIDIPNVEQTRTREAVDGIIYNVYTLNKKQIIPQQTGQLSIEPANFVFSIQQRVAPTSIFDDFFGSTRSIRKQSSTPKVTINVKDLPTAPGGFKGAVGDFKLSSEVNTNVIKANNAITLKVTISGNGNLKHINPLELNYPADFEIYDPNTNYNIRVTDAGIIGSTTFEQVVIPRYEGEFTIPAKPFVFFNPNTKKYQTLYTKEFKIKVEKGDESQNTSVVSTLSKEDVRFIGQDIRYIKNDGLALLPFNQFFIATPKFYLIYLIAIVVFVLVLILQRKRAKENANAALMRNKQANKMARKHLKSAGICVKNNNTDQFYDAILKAFWGYLSDKLNIPMAELNRDNARTTLQKYQVNEETINNFIEMIDVCEMARYAPSASNMEIGEFYKQAEKLIGQFEKQIRKKIA